MVMDVAAWQKRLSDTFSTDGVVAARVKLLLDAEAEHGAVYAEKFSGQMTLGESFKDFCLETFELLNRVVGMQRTVVVTHHYVDFVGRHTMNFEVSGLQKCFAITDTLCRVIPYYGTCSSKQSSCQQSCRV